MASARSINMSNYCDSVYDELMDAKSRILGLAECIDQMQGQEKEMVKTHIRHLHDIANTIDWKLEILTKVCPTDWNRYSAGAESSVSVRSPEGFEKDFAAGGDVGG
jgi:hypothetical protein